MHLRMKFVVAVLLLVLILGVPLGLGQQPEQGMRINPYSIWLKLSLMGHSQSEIEALLEVVPPEQMRRVKHRLRMDVLNTLVRLNLPQEIEMSNTPQELIVIREKIRTEIRYAGMENDPLLLHLIWKPLGTLVHGTLVAILGFVVILPPLWRGVDASAKALLVISGLGGLATLVVYTRTTWVRTFLTVMSPAPLLFLAAFLLTPSIRKVVTPPETEIVEAAAIHGGQFENYGIHAMEALQSIVEFRKGGETGISQIEVLYDDEFWDGARSGKWPFELAAAAMQLETGEPFTLDTKIQDPPRYVGWAKAESHGWVITYKDGTRGYVLKIGANSLRWSFACRLKGETQVQATQFHPGPWKLRNLFKAFARAIQHFFIHGQSPHPVERCLLANGATLAAVDAYEQGGGPLATPHLEFGYTPLDFREFREMGESWRTITPEGTPEPPGIAPVFKPS